MGALFEVLAEPNRRRILEVLGEGERPVGDLVEVLDVSQPAVRSTSACCPRRRPGRGPAAAQRRLYRMRPDGLRELDEWLAPFRAAWADRLDDLERVVDDLAD